MFKRDENLPWHPSYFLAALGAGGLALSIFIISLLFIVPHPTSPIPTYSDWTSTLSSNGLQSPVGWIILISLPLIVILSLLHFMMLFWNISEYKKSKDSEAFNKLANSPGEVNFLAIPLTFSMTINVFFVLGALFVPGLWDHVEYLFPVSILAFLVIAYKSLKIFGRYMGRMLTEGGYRSEEHNHLAPLMAAFNFSFLSVGFAGPAAMSNNTLTISIAAFLSVLFMVATVIISLIVLITGFHSMMKHGVAEAATPSLWMMVPILTVISIANVRLDHGFATLFHEHSSKTDNYIMLTVAFSLQILILIAGFKVMRLNGYLKSYFSGNKYSPISFGAICPGVGFAVLFSFWINLGLTKPGIIEKYSSIYWSGYGLAVLIQLITLYGMIKLIKRLLLHKPVCL